MVYQALARKWRPKQFNEIVGQPVIVKALTNALTQQKLHHAYLLTGMHGVGKTTIARIFAKSLNCESGVTSTPCDQCNHCAEINAGCFPDLFEIDAASRTKVEDTRELLDNIPYVPVKGRFKIYLIDEVHMLSGHSFNALLKTLEEPPSHVKFLLATTDPQKLPATVLSRCLQFHLSKMTAEQIENQLTHILQTEQITFEPEALALLSQAASGSMRDALSLLDQCIVYCGGIITLRDTERMLGTSNQANITALLTTIHEKNAQAALSLTKTWATNGVHFSSALSNILVLLHQIAVQQLLQKTVIGLAKQISAKDIQLFYNIALNGQKDLPYAPNEQIGFEMIVMRMITASSSSEKIHWDTLLEKLHLTGSTLALAQHCILSQFTENSLQLQLKPCFAALLNTQHQTRIQSAVTDYFQRPIQVTVTIQEHNAKTPAESAKRLKEEKNQLAEAKITTDPTVQRILKQFDAAILKDSIEPL